MTRAALALLALVALYMLGRRSRVEPDAPAPDPEDDDYVPMAAWTDLPHRYYTEWRN